ncbi:MAG: alpha/beta hydrolase [Proteobacteria bacterium]|nr:alpha/beta hydrolase [Pseudomonadota bacterium]
MTEPNRARAAQGKGGKPRVQHRPLTDNAALRAEHGMPQVLRAPRPDSESRAFMRLVNLTTWLPMEARSVRTQRAVWRMTALAMGRRPHLAAVRTQWIPGPGGPIELRVFVPGPSTQPRPAFLWCHGGGFMLGGPETSESICRSIASIAGCIVIAVRYRLAPEHDLFASREDFLAALHWVHAHGASLGIDVERLAIGGDSAGGNVTAAVAQRVTQAGGPKLALQVLVYPATDLSHRFESLAENASGYVLTQKVADRIGQIINIPPNADDPWLSPRRNPWLHDLPPALVLSAGFDPIRDDALDYSARLRAAGVPVQLLHYAGQFHGFLNFDSIIGAARDALQRVAVALAAAFDGRPLEDQTIEIAERAGARRSKLAAAAGELAQTTLTACVMAGRWHFTLLGQFARRSRDAAQLLRDTGIVADLTARRSMVANVERLSARHTYPST